MAQAQADQRSAPMGGRVVGWDAKTGQALAQLPGGGIIPLRPISNGHPNAGPLEIGGSDSQTRPDGDWPPRPQRPDDAPEPTVMLEIQKERLGDLPNPEPFEVKVSLGITKSMKFPRSEILRITGKVGKFKAEEVGIDPEEIVASIHPREANFNGSRLTWDEGSSRACICTNCKPQIVFEGVTNADNPILNIDIPNIPTLKRKRVHGVINPDIRLYWRLIEVGHGLSGLRYAQGEVSEEGELLQLPPTFRSNFSYNGYMEVQIGCYLSQNNEILWPRGQRTNPG